MVDTTFQLIKNAGPFLRQIEVGNKNVYRAQVLTYYLQCHFYKKPLIQLPKEVTSAMG